MRLKERRRPAKEEILRNIVKCWLSCCERLCKVQTAFAFAQQVYRFTGLQLVYFPQVHQLVYQLIYELAFTSSFTTPSRAELAFTSSFNISQIRSIASCNRLVVLCSSDDILWEENWQAVFLSFSGRITFFDSSSVKFVNVNWDHPQQNVVINNCLHGLSH